LISASHGAPLASVFDGFDGRTWFAICGIACADLTMAVFFKYLDAQSYNFCRVLATWLQVLLVLEHELCPLLDEGHYV
jgi:hypothetical protein